MLKTQRKVLNLYFALKEGTDLDNNSTVFEAKTHEPMFREQMEGSPNDMEKFSLSGKTSMENGSNTIAWESL